MQVVANARRVEVQVVCEVNLPAHGGVPAPMGIDVGIKERVALSDGTLFPGVKPDKTRLKRLQKGLSRKVAGVQVAGSSARATC